ncbi:unnamed protein product [Ectocarpus sp. 6 AP-2014]
MASRTDRTRGTLCVLLKTPIIVMMPCHERRPSHANTRVRGRWTSHAGNTLRQNAKDKSAPREASREARS